MIRHVIFKPEAECDLAEAYQWYEERELGLGAEFMRSIDSCIHEIQRHPEIYPVVYKDVRQGVARRFPYSILYIIQEDTAFIMSVFHAARDPQSWKDRV